MLELALPAEIPFQPGSDASDHSFSCLFHYFPDWTTIIALSVLLLASLVANFSIPRYRKTTLVLGILYLLLSTAVAVHSLWSLCKALRNEAFQTTTRELAAEASTTLALVLLFFIIWAVFTLILLVKRGRRKLWETH